MSTDTYTREQIQRELDRWARNLTNAKATSNTQATRTSRQWLDTWLDRLNQLPLQVPA